LSNLPAVGTTLIGLLAGLWLRRQKSASAKTMGLAAGAAACLAAGYLWSAWFPLNKQMWTSSYVLVAAGWSLALLALAFWAVEQRGWCREGWGKASIWPWLVFGSNAIVAYMTSELLPGALGLIRFTDGRVRSNPEIWVHIHVFMRIHDPGWRAFAFSATYTLVCFIPVWMLYRRRIFVKV
jgi:predicted acyltransferase